MSTKKAAAKKAVKKTAKKSAAAAAPATEGRKGRVSAYAGLKLKKLVADDATGLRLNGKVRECWNVIKNGMTFEAYREAAPDGGLARRCLADFITKGLVEVV